MKEVDLQVFHIP